MRFVLIDLRGNQRGSFESRAELSEDLQETLLENPASLRSLYVLTYDDEGQETGTALRADEALVKNVVHSTALFAGAALSGAVFGSATTQILRRDRPVAGVVGTRSGAVPA